jgi:hypothetical protein
MASRIDPEEGQGESPLPNGADNNSWRLVIITVALYQARFKDWPTEVRMAPIALWSLAQIARLEKLETLANRRRLRTTLRGSLVARSSRGRAHSAVAGQAHRQGIVG